VISISRQAPAPTESTCSGPRRVAVATESAAVAAGAIDHPGTAGRGESIGKIDLLRSDRMIEKGLCPNGDPQGGRIPGGAGRMAGIR